MSFCWSRHSRFTMILSNLLLSLRVWPIAVLPLCVALAGCQTVAPNLLTAADTAALRFASIEIRVPASAVIKWPVIEDDYLHSHGFTVGDQNALQSPAARTFIAEKVSQRLKSVLERVVSERPGGERPVKLVVAVTSVVVPSVAERMFIGNKPAVGADIDIVDIRTGAVLTRYQGDFRLGVAGQGIGGTLLDAALTEAGVNKDLFDRAAYSYAYGFMHWLERTP